MSDDTRTSQVFLSYAAVDRERALAVAEALEAAGLRIWIDRKGIAGGSGWAAEITAAIRTCAAVAVLCSRDSMTSRNVRQELQLAWDFDRPIVPLLLEAVDFPDGIAYFLHGTQWVELIDRPAVEWAPEAVAAFRPFLPETGSLEPPAVALATQITGNMPSPLTSLIGREVEIARVVALLTDGATRLVTLTGPGGVGKTRVATAAAKALQPEFADGCWFVDLAPLTDPELVPQTISLTLGLRDEGDQTPADRLATYLREKRLLLVLDNFEHLVRAARVVTGLLAHTAHLRVLVTSRMPLHLSGERELTIDPLPIPAANHEISPDLAASYPVVRLFVERAESAHPGFALTPENTSSVFAICARLDGMPLAIELAAARTKLLPPAKLLARLEQSLPVLTSGPRDLPARQQTLRDTIAWSYDLLTPSQQTLFRRLAVFAGGCTFEAADAVGNHDGSVNVMDDLTGLVEMSLIRRSDDGDEPRFRMFETIREFALEQLDASHESVVVRDALADYFLAVVEPEWRHPGYLIRSRLTKQLCLDRASFLSALQWLHVSGAEERAVRLAANASSFWYVAGPASEGLSWLERSLAPDLKIDPQLRAWALQGASNLAHRSGDIDSAVKHAECAITLFEEIGDDLMGLAWSLQSRGIAAHYRGDHADADHWCTKSLTLFHNLEDPWGEGITLSNLGISALTQGDELRAEQFLTAARDLLVRTGDAWTMSWLLPGLAGLAIRRGDIATAVDALEQAAASQPVHDDPISLSEIAAVTATLAMTMGDAAIATRLFSAESKVREATGPTEYVGFLDDRERALAEAKQSLGDAVFAAAWSEGRSLDPESILHESRSALVPYRSASQAEC